VGYVWAMQSKQPRQKGGRDVWRCSRCKRWLFDADYYLDRRTPNGLKAQCKRCHTESSVRTRDSDNHRRIRRESASRSRGINPGRFQQKERARPRRSGPKVDARQMVYLALRIGALTKPVRCSGCGKKKRLTAHHNDYKKPLDIVWLCYLCHAQEHR